LQYGWIAMNRQGRSVRIAPPAVDPAATARILKMADSESAVIPCLLRPNKRVVLPPANALCITSP